MRCRRVHLWFSATTGGKLRLRAAVRAVDVPLDRHRTKGVAVPERRSAERRRKAESCRPAGLDDAFTGFVGGEYLTDEVFLYRVVGLVTNQAEAAVILEDCYGLDIVEVRLARLRARRFRIVTPDPCRLSDG